MKKKLVAPFLAISLLISTSTSALPGDISRDPAYIATVVAGVIMTGGGVYLLVKNPKSKKESFLKRSARFAGGIVLAAGGITLIFVSKPLHKHIAVGNGFDADATWHAVQNEASGFFRDAGTAWKDFLGKVKTKSGH